MVENIDFSKCRATINGNKCGLAGNCLAVSQINMGSNITNETELADVLRRINYLENYILVKIQEGCRMPNNLVRKFGVIKEAYGLK